MRELLALAPTQPRGVRGSSVASRRGVECRSWHGGCPRCGVTGKDSECYFLLEAGLGTFTNDLAQP